MSGPDPSITLTIDPRPHLSALHQAVDGHLGALRVALRSLEDGSFVSKAAMPRPGALLQFSFDQPAASDDAAAQLCNRCFVSVIGDLVTYLDRMIAFKRCTSQQVLLPSGAITQTGVLQHVQRLLEAEYATVARDRQLTNPKKLEQFRGIASVANDTCRSYFAVRRFLEHHSGLPDADMTLSYGRLKLLAGDLEVTQAGQAAPPGVAISLGMEHTSRAIPAGVPVVLTEEELEHIVFTIQHIIGPEIRRVLIEDSAPPPAPEVA